MTETLDGVTVWAALRERIAVLEASGAVVGIAATDLASGRHLGYREDQLFPLASVIKLPILAALYEEVVAGRAELRERVTYRASSRVPGSGVLQHLDDGLTLTLRDLAVLMMVVSDNTAAEVLTERLSKSRIEAAMAGYGLPTIRMPFGVRAGLYELVDLDASLPGQYDEAQRRLRVSAGSGGRAIVPELTDRGSPRDLARLVELIERHAILNEWACDDLLDILRRGGSGPRIGRLLPKATVVAHKTGTIRGVRNDVGIVYAPGGPYAIAILSRQVPRDLDADPLIAEISHTIYESFLGM